MNKQIPVFKKPKVYIKTYNSTKIIPSTHPKSIAIIIPFRNREKHLSEFMDHFKKLALKDIHHYDVFVIEQTDIEKFNRGLLLNIGYLVAKKNKRYDRIIFHDVDSYPDQHLFNQYSTNLKYNIHFASPHLGYKYKYENFVGGVIGMKMNDFESVNGFSTIFFGWGGEDDSFYTRMAIKKVPLYRPSAGVYRLVDHAPPTNAEKNIHKYKNRVYDYYNWKTNGLNQLTRKTNNPMEYSIYKTVKLLPKFRVVFVKTIFDSKLFQKNGM
jgi:hypothetical protein